MSYLSKETIEQLRHSVNSINWPLSIKDWPEDLNIYTNCLAFACGFTVPDFDDSIFIPPENVAITNHLENLFKLSGISYKKILSLDKAKDDEIIILLYDIPDYDFHLVRRNSDKTWVHKVGWMNSPEFIDSLESIEDEFPRKFITQIFAVKKRTS